jgi:hypothetical protein
MCVCVWVSQYQVVVVVVVVVVVLLLLGLDRSNAWIGASSITLHYSSTLTLFSLTHILLGELDLAEGPPREAVQKVDLVRRHHLCFGGREL